MGFAELYERQKGLQERAERFPSGSFRIEYEERPEETDTGGGETRKDIYELFTEQTLLSRFTPKSKGEIIRSGTAREKAALRLADFEAGQIVGCENLCTEKETKELIESAEALGEEGYEEYLFFLSEFSSLTTYEKDLRSIYCTTQTELAEIAMLVNEWDDLKKLARTLSVVNRNSCEWERAKREGKGAEYIAELLKMYPENYTPESGEAVCVINTEGAGHLFYFDEEAEEIKVTIEGPGRMYGTLLYRAERVRGFLSTLKAAVNAVAEYIDENGGDLLLIPYGLECILREVWNETYLNLLVSDKGHLRSELIRRQAEGEEITEEEVREAVIPDYYETEESESRKRHYKSKVWSLSKYRDTLANVRLKILHGNGRKGHTGANGAGRK